MHVNLFPVTVASLIATCSLLAGLALFYKKQIHPIIRTPAIILCSLVFISSFFLSIYCGAATIEWYRVCRGGKLYVRTVIMQPENHEFIVWSERTNQKEEEQSKKVLKEFSNNSFKVILIDHYYEGLEFMAYLNEVDVLFIALEVPGAYFGKLGVKPEYRLRVIEQPINGRVSFCRYGAGGDGEKENPGKSRDSHQ
jgi:hypothetical protein